jgi:hypothetical protein
MGSGARAAARREIKTSLRRSAIAGEAFGARGVQAAMMRNAKIFVVFLSSK